MEAKQLCRVSEVPDGGARVVDEACIGRPVIVVRRGEQVWA
ncbi:Rieske (2Fe-2S) protein, partial [Bacteroides thetaiotaomicron]|nr:Rieske (2Fe-2S) protein [Bacteroides thetaiotaomicron]